MYSSTFCLSNDDLNKESYDSLDNFFSRMFVCVDLKTKAQQGKLKYCILTSIQSAKSNKHYY